MTTLPEQQATHQRKSYSALIDQTQSALLRTARRLCNGGEDCAQDLVQDALIAGYEAFLAGRFQQGSNARAWLTRILTNRFINEYNRDRKWRAGLTVEELTAGGAAGPASTHAPASERPESALLDAALDEPMERALMSLTPDLRATVVLVDVEEMEYADAAKALGIPIGTVRSRLFRARMQMHAALTGSRAKASGKGDS